LWTPGALDGRDGAGSTIGNRQSADIDAIADAAFPFRIRPGTFKWGDDRCFKVGGKIFRICGLDPPRLCFPSPLEGFAELMEREDIRPAPYVGRYKWVIGNPVGSRRRLGFGTKTSPRLITYETLADARCA